MLHTAPHIDRKNRMFDTFAEFIKKKTEILHGSKYSDPLLS